MNLPAAGQGPGAGEEFEEPAPVFVNVLGVIFVEAGEVKRILRHRTDAAPASRKRVGETILFQRRANQSAHAVAFAPVEARVFGFGIVHDRFDRS